MEDRAKYVVRLTEEERVRAYATVRLQEKVRQTDKTTAPATINRELACLRTMLRLAQERGLIDKVPRIRLLPERNRRTRTASPNEQSALAAHLTGQYRVAYLLLRDTGMRISDVVGLQIEQVNVGESLLTFIDQKTGYERKVPLSVEAGNSLRLLIGERINGESRVFLNSKGQPMTRYNFTKAFRGACKAAGIRGLWVHDFRRTFSTERLEQGWDRAIIKEITGHRSDAAFDRYVAPRLDTLRRAVEKIAPHYPHPQ